MSPAAQAFVAAIGPPETPVPSGLSFPMPFDQMVWDSLYAEIGGGWFKDRFYYLFGRGVKSYSQLLDDWSFALPPDRDYQVIGRNAYGALLLLENLAQKGFTSPVRLLNPVVPAFWGDDNMVLMNCIGHWLPNGKIPGFSDRKLYDAFGSTTGARLEADEILAIKTPVQLGGAMVADNFQVENIFEFYKSTALVYAPLFEKK